MGKLSRILGIVGATVIGTALVCSGQAAKPETEELKIPNAVVKFDMVKVPGGKVTIKGKDGKEKEVEVKPLWVGKTEVTWDEYDIFWQRLDLTADEIQKGVDAENRPSKPYSPPDRGFGRTGWPAGSITYAEAQKYVKWLSKVTNKKYRLPTQAEWVYITRCGGPAVAPKGDALKEVAWYEANSDEKTHQVATKKASAWGLFDTLGNVAEWTVREDGAGVAMGGSFQDEGKEINCCFGYEYDASWQRDDPQDPKGKSWLSNGAHVGIRVVREDK